MKGLLVIAVVTACSSSKSSPKPAPDAGAADPGVAACELFHARMRTCEEPIVQAVAARKPGAELAGLRAKLNAPASCAGARADKMSPAAACSSEDCIAMASCVADVLAPEPPDVVVRPGGFDGNVLFVMIDTVRADRLGVGGYRRDGVSITPRLDAVSVGAVRFTRAYAQGPNTPRSLPSMWTSRYPSQIAYEKVFHNFPRVKDEAAMMFESLAGARLLTTGFSSHYYFARVRNVAQGFDEYDNTGAQPIKPSNTDFAAPRIIPRAISRLDELAATNTRFAMFVHLFEPHSTYLEHDEHPVTLEGTAGLEAKYDYEIAVSDRYVGELLDALDRLALTERTIVVILSDHGEAFGVHRDVEGDKLFFHGQALYDEVLRVPLMIRVPGVAPAVRDDLVALIDVAPTLLDLLGIEPPPSFVGRSLVPIMRGEALPPRPVGAILQATPGWKYSARALITGDGAEKIIVHGDGKVEVFDLAADPEEREDLAKTDPARTKRLQAALDAWEQGL